MPPAKLCPPERLQKRPLPAIRLSEVGQYVGPVSYRELVSAG